MESGKIKKIDLINNIYNKSEKGVEKQFIQDVVDQFLMELKASLIEGNTIELRGFGTFEPKLKNEKKGARNLVTGEIVTVEPHYVAAFKPGQELKEQMKNLKVGENE